jgi:hypothetical protein
VVDQRFLLSGSGFENPSLLIHSVVPTSSHPSFLPSLPYIMNTGPINACPWLKILGQDTDSAFAFRSQSTSSSLLSYHVVGLFSTTRYAWLRLRNMKLCKCSRKVRKREDLLLIWRNSFWGWLLIVVGVDRDMVCKG